MRGGVCHEMRGLSGRCVYYLYSKCAGKLNEVIRKKSITSIK